MTIGMLLLSIYVISAIVCGALHWAEYMDDKKKGYEKSLKEKVIYLYLIPLAPIFNIIAIIFSIVDFIS